MGLLIIAGCVAIVARRLKIPYTIGLMLAGMGIAFLPFFENMPTSKSLLLYVFLPPLVFEAAIQIPWKELRGNLPVVLLLATAGVGVSCAVTALGMKQFAGWDWSGALLFGALIAATDPVSVITTFKEAGVHGRLRILVESESLFNDGAAAVIFAVILAAASGTGVPTAGGTVRVLALSIAGGVMCGAIVAFAISLLMRITRDSLVQFTFTTVIAYGSFLVAEHFHFSGILACVTAGLVIGNIDPLVDVASEVTRTVWTYWEYIGFLANSLIFLGIGIAQIRQEFLSVMAPAIIALIFVLLGRAFAVYPFCALFHKSALRISAKHQHVLFWGGLRGALALAFAVELPDGMPLREEIISVTFAVVAFSIFVQGLTMTPLLRRVGAISPPAA